MSNEVLHMLPMNSAASRRISRENFGEAKERMGGRPPTSCSSARGQLQAEDSDVSDARISSRGCPGRSLRSEVGGYGQSSAERVAKTKARRTRFTTLNSTPKISLLLVTCRTSITASIP